MIIVTGATGQLGRRVVEHLITRVPPQQVGVSVRDPAGAADLAAAGVRVRRGDFADPGTLPDALEGVDQLLLVSSNARAYGGDPLEQHRVVIDAARGAGARRIVYTSQMAASPTSKFPPARDHAATEAVLAGSGMAWTALRHGFYATSALAAFGAGLRAGLVEAAEDGPVAWTTHDDLAEADAAVLADEGRFDGPTPPLTATESLDLAALAATAAQVLGHPVERRVLTEQEVREQLRARGLPDGVASIALGQYAASRDGEFDRVDPALEDLIGRRPTTMRSFIEAQLRPS